MCGRQFAQPVTVAARGLREGGELRVQRAGAVHDGPHVLAGGDVERLMRQVRGVVRFPCAERGLGEVEGEQRPALGVRAVALSDGCGQVLDGLAGVPEVQVDGAGDPLEPGGVEEVHAGGFGGYLERGAGGHSRSGGVEG